MFKAIGKTLRWILAGIGLCLLVAVGLFANMPQWRELTVQHLLPIVAWRVPPLLSFGARTVPRVELKDLPVEQRRAVLYLSSRYSVAPGPLAALMQQAVYVGKETQLDPYLIMAVGAVESSFNPYAQSAQGAQGLMQVITRIHAKRFDAYGGPTSTFDPLVNLRVGAYLLREFINLKGGAVEDGLRYYLGGDNTNELNEGGYVGKVLREQSNLQQVASGHAPTAR